MYDMIVLSDGKTTAHVGDTVSHKAEDGTYNGVIKELDNMHQHALLEYTDGPWKGETQWVPDELLGEAVSEAAPPIETVPPPVEETPPPIEPEPTQEETTGEQSETPVANEPAVNPS